MIHFVTACGEPPKGCATILSKHHDTTDEVVFTDI